MPPALLTVRVAGLGLLLATSAALAAESKTGWVEAKTAHVTVKTDLGLPGAEAATFLAEVTRAALLAAAWPGTTLSQDRIELVVFSSHQDFQYYFGDLVDHQVGSSGYPPRVFLYGSPDRWEKRSTVELEETTSVLRRVLVRHLASFFYRRQPRWFAVGLAEFFETLRVSADGKAATFGGMNVPAMGHYATNRTLTVADAQAWGRTLNPQDEATRLGLEGLSWLMVQWMYTTHLPEFVRFQRLLLSGMDPTRAWTVVFPVDTLGNIDQVLNHFAQYGTLYPATVALPESHFTVDSKRPMTSAEVHAIRAEAALASGLAKEAQAELSAALADDPGNVGAVRMQLALVKPAERVALARRATAAHPDDGLAWLALGDALQGENEPSDERSQAYRKAIALSPDHPLVCQALASLDLQQGRPRDALPLALTAVRVAPWEAVFIDTLAAALAGVGRCSEAVSMQARAMETAPQGSGATQAGYVARLAEIQKSCTEAPSAKPALSLRAILPTQPFNNEYRFMLYDTGLVIVQRSSKENLVEYFSVELTPQEMASFLDGLQLTDFLKLAANPASPSSTELPLYEIAALDPQARRLRAIAISGFDDKVAEPAAFARVHRALESYSDPRERRWFPDSVFLNVKRATEKTLCVWPSDWENFASVGSLTLPLNPDPRADLGFIRAKGERLTDIQRFLHKCRHLVLLNGEAVLLTLVVRLPHEAEAAH